MNLLFCYTNNNIKKYTNLTNIVDIIKIYCSTNNKSLGSNYYTYFENHNIDDLLKDTNYNNKCMLLKKEDMWELIEKKIDIVETGWIYSNKIKQPSINILQTYNIINLCEEKYNNDLIDTIKNGKFDNLYKYCTIKNSLLMSKHYDILFSGCKNIDIIKHFIDICDDIEHIDENNKKIINYVVENPTNITLDIVKYLIINKNIDIEWINNDGQKLVHIVIKLYNKSFMYKNIYDDIIIYLIGLDIDLISNTYNNFNLLHYVCMYGSENTIKTLVIKYNNINNIDIVELINSKTVDGDTPLHLICKYKYGINLIKFMIDNGANKSIYNKKGYFPFNYIPVGKSI
jgi:hypothetical protein